MENKALMKVKIWMKLCVIIAAKFFNNDVLLMYTVEFGAWPPWSGRRKRWTLSNSSIFAPVGFAVTNIIACFNSWCAAHLYVFYSVDLFVWLTSSFFARFHVSMVVLWRIQVFRDVMLCCWVSVSWCFKGA